MKRIELHTGTSERGFWDGNTFDYKLKIHVASYDYNFNEDEYLAEYEKAKGFIEQNGGSADQIGVFDIASGQEVFNFKTEDIDSVIENSEADNFYIYLEKTNGDNLF